MSEFHSTSPSNKRQISDESRRLMSIAQKARCTPEERAARSELRRTKLDDEKLKLLYESGMTQSEIANDLGLSQKVIWRALKRIGVTCRSQVPRDQRGSKNGGWKGDHAAYAALHLRVMKARGKPMQCESCGENDPAKHYDWANLTGRYEDIDDYKRLCRSCHSLLDSSRRKETGQSTITVKR